MNTELKPFHISSVNSHLDNVHMFLSHTDIHGKRKPFSHIGNIAKWSQFG